MSNDPKKLQDALGQIADIASKALANGNPNTGNPNTGNPNVSNPYGGNPNISNPNVGPGIGTGDGKIAPAAKMGCSILTVPQRLVKRAADTAVKINPANAPMLGALTGAGVKLPDPQALILLTSKYWGPTPRQLTVSFMESQPPELRARILSHMNAWNTSAGISFVETSGIGQVRITTGPGGFKSYLGTDILLIPQDRPTMYLEGFSMNTDESEYRRVVRHETGHTLGFPHEHMRQELVARIDPQKAYVYYLQTQGWDKAMVDAQVLTPLDQSSIMGTPPDETSIMCYQVPDSITIDGQPILGGTDINVTDYAFAAMIYPKFTGNFQLGQFQATTPAAALWPASEDVTDEQVNKALRSTVTSQLMG